LFLEETNEPPYKIDRMLTQLKHANKLRDAVGFVLGDFSVRAPNVEEHHEDEAKQIKLAVSELLESEQKPMVYNFPSGHCMPNLTLPLGQSAEICEGKLCFR
jgi:muramoyltetrapeptide carboxypeptidase